MTLDAWAFLLSSLLVSIVPVRAGCRALLANKQYKLAQRKKAQLDAMTAHAKQATKIEINDLQDSAKDLIEFTALTPTWAVWCALLGIGLNILTRLYLLMSGPLN